MSLNHIVLMGRIARDPELRKTPSDVSVVSFTVAVDRDYKQGDEKVTDWIDCTAWRGTADFISRNFSKGRMICVEGALNSRKWQDKEGNNRISWFVQVSNVYFADSKKDAAPQNPQYQTNGAPQFEEAEQTEGDLPF